MLTTEHEVIAIGALQAVHVDFKQQEQALLSHSLLHKGICCNCHIHLTMQLSECVAATNVTFMFMTAILLQGMSEDVSINKFFDDPMLLELAKQDAEMQPIY